MTRRMIAAMAVGALAVSGATACSSTSGDAARVGNDRFSKSDFTDFLDAYTSASKTGLLPSGNLDATMVRTVLLDWIRTAALERSLSDLGVEVTRAELDKAEASLLLQPGFSSAPDLVRAFYVRATAVRSLTGDTFSPNPEETANSYTAGPKESGVACLRLILTESKDAIDTAAARLAAGESFDAVAKDTSTDTSAALGGILKDTQSDNECYALDVLTSQIVEQIGAVIPDLQPGVATSPIEVPKLGWVIVVLRPYAEVTADVAKIIGPVAATRLADSILDTANVWVNPEYGRWDATSRQVVADTP